jgi:RNA polymerase sigma factor (sigma-70 family)
MSGVAGVHEALLRRGFQAGVAEHGRLDLPFEDFARRALDCASRRVEESGLPRTPEQTAEVLERLAAADLYLAAACDLGLPPAWQVFTERFLPRLRRFARSRGASETEAEDLTRDLPGDLALPPASGSARSRIGTYEGTGNLFGWLAVIVLRRLADRARAPRLVRAGDPAAGEEEDDAPRAAIDRDDPAGAAEAGEAARSVGRAFPAAWRTLTPQEALALLYRFRDGLAQREIARLFQVTESRISHLLRGATGKLRDALVREVRDLEPDRWPDGDRLWHALSAQVARFWSSSPAPSDPRMRKRPGP